MLWVADLICIKKLNNLIKGNMTVGIVGVGTEAYLYLCGISCGKIIKLHDNVILQPLTEKLNIGELVKLIKNDIDFSILVLSNPTLSLQLKISSNDSKNLALSTWNAQWDCILLSAIFNCEVNWHIQSYKPVEESSNSTYIHITNYHFYGLLKKIYCITKEDEKWIEDYYISAFKLMEDERFETAIHSLSSYKWHPNPRIQLAIIWSGIKSLFNVSTEISFRLSLYIANFLGSENFCELDKIFQETKKLYNLRSSAVHGNNKKVDFNLAAKKIGYPS